VTRNVAFARSGPTLLRPGSMTVNPRTQYTGASGPGKAVLLIRLEPDRTGLNSAEGECAAQAILGAASGRPLLRCAGCWAGERDFHSGSARPEPPNRIGPASAGRAGSRRQPPRLPGGPHCFNT
jgi:hypothetical protein